MHAKIHIIGSPGSGKSYLSKKLAEHLNAPLLELDQIHWDNSASEYNTLAPESERDAKLLKFTQQESWIIEGIYYKWLDISFDSADIIIILDNPNLLRNFRIIKRFLLAKIGIRKTNENNLKSLYELITWGNSFSDKNIPKIIEKTDIYKNKRHFFKSADEAFEFLVEEE